MHEFAEKIDHPALPEPRPWDGEHRVLMLGRPESMNTLGSRGNRHAQQGSKKSWQAVVAKRMMELAPRDRFAYVEAAAELRYARPLARFDEDNFRSPIAKFLGDALDGGSAWRSAGGRWLPDDSSEFFRLREVSYRVVKPLKGASSQLLPAQRVTEAPSTLIVFRYLERCPHEFGDARPTPEGPKRSLCALPVAHVGECLDMKGARAGWSDPASVGWREVRP